MRDLLDTTCPKRLVEQRVETHIGSAHCFLGEGTDSFDGLWRSLLEGAPKEVLVQMHGVFAGDYLREGVLVHWKISVLGWVRFDLY